MTKKLILDLCGGTGSWSKYYAEDNDYKVEVITLPDFDVTKKEVIDYCINLKPYGILAAPPCRMFSIARNDKTAKQPRDLDLAMQPVRGCLEIIWQSSYNRELKFWALENPMGYLKLFLGRPFYIFQPYEFGDPYTKKTCLWGNFNEPKKKPVKPREFEHPTSKGCRDFVSCVEHFVDLKNIPEGYAEKTGYNKRTILRSMTPLGFSKQFYLANR